MGDAGKPNFDAQAIWAKVQANRDALDACPRHLFGRDIPGIEQGVGAMLGQKVRCKKCGGMMDLTALNYYIRGFEAAGGNGNDILPGWKEEPGNGRRYFKPPEDA